VARIFLCHASEDKAQVREVYHRLRSIDGFEPWLDEEDLLPGQEWAREIPRALRVSDFILIFLSRNSLAKRGYVQREMKLALDAWQELPEGTIHTIPVRINDCEVPEDFQRYHWVNLFDSNGFDRIVRAIHAELAKRLATAPPDPILDRDHPFSGATGRSVIEVPGHFPQEPEPPTGSQPEEPLVPPKKFRQVSVVTIMSLVITAVSAVAAVILVPGMREWLGLDTPRKITTAIGMEFVRIPAGQFQMGSNEVDKDERPMHRVRISEPFYLGKYEVTQAQWEAVMGTNPSSSKGNPGRPVTNVSWEDIQEFIRRLNQQEGWEVCRLPTEAQWEYAARAGTTMEWYENDVDAIAWYAKNSGDQTHEVGQKRPNAWGVYDMLGNVWEWCHDGKRKYTADTAIDPMGPTGAGTDRVIRGGSLANSEGNVRAGLRVGLPPGERLADGGFRCACSGRWR
jgi:formylglycine-generating enzyme required for sulfatase activity